MSEPLGADEITILDAPLVPDSRHGGMRRDWDAATAATVRGCSVQPYRTDEALAATDAVDREFINTHVRLFCPPGTPLTRNSRVTAGGITYDVDGEPARWTDLDGAASHIEATLKRTEG